MTTAHLHGQRSSDSSTRSSQSATTMCSWLQKFTGHGFYDKCKISALLKCFLLNESLCKLHKLLLIETFI